MGHHRDNGAVRMQRAADAAAELDWLRDRPDEEAATGYDQAGWAASVWILHAMYHNEELDGLGSHGDRLQAGVRSGAIAPAMIGDVNLDERTTTPGIPLGFTRRPWRRLLWRDHLAGHGPFPPEAAVPPCHRWFPHASFPWSIGPPPEGSLDEASFDALVAVLAEHSSQGQATETVAFYGSLPSGDFDAPHVWSGPLGDVGELIVERGGSYRSSPTNLWARDHSWFIWTDWDLMGTKVSGTGALVRALDVAGRLETVDWTVPAS
jgi:hypothetical protein